MDIKERLKEAKQFPDDMSNCLGTALYLLGEKETPFHVEADEFKKNYLPKLTEITNPVDECIVGFLDPDAVLAKEYQDWYNHAAFIMSASPELVYHRVDKNGSKVRKTTLDDLKLAYRDHTMHYFVPTERVAVPSRA